MNSNYYQKISGWTEPGVWVCTTCGSRFLVKQGKPVPDCPECGSSKAQRCPDFRIVSLEFIKGYKDIADGFIALLARVKQENITLPLQVSSTLQNIEKFIGQVESFGENEPPAENESEKDDQESHKRREPEPDRKTYMCDTCGDILSTKQLIEGHICTNCRGHWKPWPEYVTIHMNEYLEYLKLKKKIKDIQKLVEKWKCTKKMDEDDPSSHCPGYYADYPCRCDNDQRVDILMIINKDESQFYEKIRKIDNVLAEENGRMW